MIEPPGAKGEAPVSPASLRALYEQAQILIADTQRNLDRLAELMRQLEAHLSLADEEQEKGRRGEGETSLEPRGSSTEPPAASLQSLRSPTVNRWFVSAEAPEQLDDSHDELIVSNGIDATTGQPLFALDTQTASTLAQAEPSLSDEQDLQYQLHKLRVEADQEAHLGIIYGDANNLYEAGWAIVVHSQDDAALLKALSPLILQRCRDQGLSEPHLEFRDGETCGAWLARTVAELDAPMSSQIPVLLYETGEQTHTWLARHGVSLAPVDPRRGVPFYLLLVGRPGPCPANTSAYIPYSIQYELDIFWGVGRVCFTAPNTGEHRLADYAAYAERVAASERDGAFRRNRHIAYFNTKHPNDQATFYSTHELIDPLYFGHSGGSSIAQLSGFTQTRYAVEDATRTTLHTLLHDSAASNAPAILFTATHGIGFPVTDSRLPAQQGALLCQDWTGLGSMKREHWFAAEDVLPSAQIQGMIHLCFACYGAGCPHEDQFMFTLGRERHSIAPFPMVAQLPQRLLSQGALAVLGHVDRAWAYSFRSADVPAQTQGFEAVLAHLMGGERIGFATDQFNMIQGATSMRLAGEIEQLQFHKQISNRDLSSLWIARNDARNYALLGDPAVRLTFYNGEQKK